MPGHPEANQDMQELIRKCGGACADDLPAGIGGIGQWAQQIENGGESEGLADIGDMPHGRVVAGGVGEANVGFTQAPGFLLRVRFNIDAQHAQDIGRAGARRDRAVAMFGNRDSSGSRDDGDGRGNIEKGGGDAPGAAGVDDDVLREHLSGDGRCRHA